MEELLSRNERRGRLTLVAVTLGSGIALLDGSVVTIAMKSIGLSMGASLQDLQWVVNGYMLTLASLILIGGALGDRLGRRRVYVIGVAGFGLASAACAAAQDPGQLIALRVVQGVFAALLTPGSLAILQASFRAEDRPWAIGMWAGVSGLATAIAPLVGGFLIDHGGWRWIFGINIPLCAIVLLLVRAVPETRDEQSGKAFDLTGATLGVVTLAASTYALTFWRDDTLPAVTAAVLAVAAAVGFVRIERRAGAMVPLQLFASRVFTAANLMTFLVYGALGAGMFLLVLQLEMTAGYGPTAAGLASLPIAAMMLLFSARMATLAQRTGPRLPMSVGPILCAIGMVLLARVDGRAPYWTSVFPGMFVFACGLTVLVSPLTAAVLGAAPERHAGIASGINNAVARAGSLLAVAAIPALVGLSGEAYRDPAALTSGYRSAQLLCAVMLAGGGVVSWIGLRPRSQVA